MRINGGYFRDNEGALIKRRECSNLRQDGITIMNPLDVENLKDCNLSRGDEKFAHTQ